MIKNTMVKITVFATCFVCCVLVSPSRAADERTIAREHYVKGTKAFDLGLYDDAIREYVEAYKIRDEPVLLYNLGQAHRLAEHPNEALHFYKMYLNKVPSASNRSEVERKIGELQKLVDQQRKTQSGLPPDHSLKSVPTPKEAAVVAEPPPKLPLPIVTEAAPSPVVGQPIKKHSKHIWVWGVVAGVVAAGVAVGVGVGLSSQPHPPKAGDGSVTF